MGALFALRAVQSFGVDYLVMLYAYFSEESQLVDHKVYTILRHPAYAALQQIAFGLALLNGNWFAVACALTFALGLWGWMRLMEERELIERFGRAYVEYRQMAFDIKLTSIPQDNRHASGKSATSLQSTAHNTRAIGHTGHLPKGWRLLSPSGRRKTANGCCPDTSYTKFVVAGPGPIPKPSRGLLGVSAMG